MTDFFVKVTPLTIGIVGGGGHEKNLTLLSDFMTFGCGGVGVTRFFRKIFSYLCGKKAKKHPFFGHFRVSPPHAKSHKTYQKSEIFGKSMTDFPMSPPPTPKSVIAEFLQKIRSSVKKIGHR